MIEIAKGKKLILFDGVCNLCNDAVLRVIKNDKKNIFLFTAIQSKAGKEILDYLHVDINKIDSIILYEPGVSYDIKSTAALKIISNFDGFWKIAQIGWILPETVRNYIYDFIAKNRYNWFGKKNNCMIPTPKLKSKFLE